MFEKQVFNTGVAILVKSERLNSILEINPISDRLMTIAFTQQHTPPFSIIGCNAPPAVGTYTEEDRKQIYETLENTQMQEHLPHYSNRRV